ncbi:hypothetical protein [Nannocystis pusilla]|uniref:hypothetical protein n=1 Tax=Nannocystis pusilla TaxID=889268 RepID=UPI003B7738FB
MELARLADPQERLLAVLVGAGPQAGLERDPVVAEAELRRGAQGLARGFEDLDALGRVVAAAEGRRAERAAGEKCGEFCGSIS